MSGLSWRGRATSVLVAALFAVLPGAVGGRPVSAATARVEAGDLRFTPPRLEIAVGDTVEWDATDDSHTVTARDGSFDSSSRGLMGEGDFFRHRFRAPGTYAYFCRVHGSRGMQGTIVVVDPAAPVTTSSTRLTPVSASATTTTTTTVADAMTTTTVPTTTTTRVLATSSTTSLAQALATTAPPGVAAVPNDAPTMNPDARIVGSPPPEAGGLPEAQAAARRPGHSGPRTGLLAGGLAGLAALGGLGAFGLTRRRSASRRARRRRSR
ncbi:MAG TPA: plastocyanin/azurin family copper-binding protein [Acidimicrobiia bacterium]|nr:plastocyanin/azurin family copper-binding protein [Acidimicrobiia bacterium]